MAKKGGAQQLQADIQNDEDFEKFLERPGLLVLDVYAEWCGPCLGMVGALRKIKLEIGGDNLHLAICKAEGITPLKRFSRKSEPTWLFVTGGKATNIYFGTNVPKLMSLITHELKVIGNMNRTFYDIGELQPIEVQRRKVIEDAKAESERIETLLKEKKRLKYLTYVTDTIMDSLPDMGVTLFGPQVNRDMFKKLQEPADGLKIQCKDRKTVIVAKENFDVINFQCPNPLSPDVIEQLDGKELLVCFWKVPDEGNQIAAILTKYAQELTTPRYKPADDGGEEEEIPPILTTMDVKVEVELEEGEEWIEEPPETPTRRTIDGVPEGSAGGGGFGEGGEEGEEDEGDEDEDEEAAEADAPPTEIRDMSFVLPLEGVEDEEEEEEFVGVEEAPKKRTKKITVKMPPVWVPKNHRTHAALIYVFFRAATTSFLPPDPKPEPPHLIMAFDAYKKRDLIAHAERNKTDVPLYGFFTSDDPDEAKFIANSDSKYAQLPHTAGDKLIFKVNKATSNTMLSLVTYGPSYVSPNTVVGAEEAKKFFPETYKTLEQELAEKAELEREEEAKGKRKTRKSAQIEQKPTGQPGEQIKQEYTEETSQAASPRETANDVPESAEALPPSAANAEANAAPEEGSAPPPTTTDEAAPPPPTETAAPEETNPEPQAEAPAE